jgi:hypothetical protein
MEVRGLYLMRRLSSLLFQHAFLSDDRCKGTMTLKGEAQATAETCQKQRNRFK